MSTARQKAWQLTIAVLALPLTIALGCDSATARGFAAPTPTPTSKPLLSPTLRLTPTPTRSATRTTTRTTPTATPSPSATPGGITWPQISLASTVTGFNQPVHIANAADSSGRLFVVEQGGRIRLIKGGILQSTDFLNIASRVSCCGERGLLSVAFPPNYATRGHFYVYYTNTSGNIVIARYGLSANPDVADANSET